jgi:hypothetical protein
MLTNLWRRLFDRELSSPKATRRGQQPHNHVRRRLAVR